MVLIVTGCKVEDHEVGSEELVVERVVVDRGDTGFCEGGARYFTEVCSADQSARSAEKNFRLHFPVVRMGCCGTFVVCTASSRCARIDAAYACRETSRGYRLSGHRHVPGQGQTSTIDSGGMSPT